MYARLSKLIGYYSEDIKIGDTLLSPFFLLHHAIHIHTKYLVYAFGGEYLARIFSTDEEVIAITAKLFVVVALFEVIDGTQVTMLGALRGLTDVKFPMYCAVVCYLLVEIPVGYLLGFKLGLGAEGIVGGFMAGISIAAVAFIVRFRKLVKNSEIQNLKTS